MSPREQLMLCLPEPAANPHHAQPYADARQVLARQEHFVDRGAALLSTIQSLPALADLDIIDYDDPEYECDHSSSDNGMPWCCELAELRSRSLTQLTVGMLGGPPEGNTLRLVGLPELRELSVLGLPGVPMHIRIDAESFAGAPHLQSLLYTRGGGAAARAGQPVASNGAHLTEGVAMRDPELPCC